MTFIKYLPNSLTIFRIVCSIALFFLEPLGAAFLSVYFLCGLSDALDGALARKLNCSGNAGAMLDSTADAIFIFASIICIAPAVEWRSWIIVWIAAIALVRVSSLVVGTVKYRSLTFLHTYANKTAGFLVFCFPFAYGALGLSLSAAVICSAASVSAIEELLINLFSKKLDRDVKSIFRIRAKL